MSFYYVRNLLYLVGEQGNGGSSGVFHRSVHETLGGAKNTAEDMITAEDLKGIDAENKWMRMDYDEKELVCKFRTGNYGFKVFRIYLVPLQV